ncbi:MAG: repeat containing protein, partial [Cyanobacteria bacterium RYN_339]|nr:repeat containing protein [Cyanobacteria bacterium RYN_339]
NNAIRAVTQDGQTRTVAGGNYGHADGQGNRAAFVNPVAVAVDGTGRLAVADTTELRLVSPGGQVTTLAGKDVASFADGAGVDARFNTICGVAFAPDGAIWLADAGNTRVRRVAPDGSTSTIAGGAEAVATDGPGATARFQLPYGIALDPAGWAYVSDYTGHRIRRIDMRDPAHPVTTIAGSAAATSLDGPGAAATFAGPLGLALDGQGRLLVADGSAKRVRRIDLHDPAFPVTTVAGSGAYGFQDGPGESATFAGLEWVTVFGDTLFTSGRYDSMIRKLVPR